MGFQKVAPKDQRCLVLLNSVNGQQCSKYRRRGMVCCSQHADIVYAGPKRLILIEDDRDPYAEGVDAGSEGDNPYPLTPNQALAWNDGFCSMHEDYE